MQTNPELIIILKLPYEIARANRYLVNAYIAAFPNFHDIMFNKQNYISHLPPITCLVWNVPGAGSKEFMFVLRELIRIHNLMVFSSVETHMGGDHTLKITHLIGFIGHTRVDANSFSGGIWLFWSFEVVSLSVVSQSRQYIIVLITRQGEDPWYFLVIYARLDPLHRQELWHDISNFALQNNEPWMLAGDLNETRFRWERSSSIHETTRRSSAFNHWVESHQLLKVEFSGPSHTWARGNSINTRRSVRLDRTLCNTEWGLRFQVAWLTHEKI